LRGVGRSAVVAKLEHPSSVAFGDTFSHKGRRESGAVRLMSQQAFSVMTA
jgi:hypothetical protein